MYRTVTFTTLYFILHFFIFLPNMMYNLYLVSQHPGVILLYLYKAIGFQMSFDLNFYVILVSTMTII